MLAPPGDPAVAEFADRQAAPLDDDVVFAPAGADRPVGQHARHRRPRARARRTTPARPTRTIPRPASVRVDAFDDPPTGQRQHHVVVPAREVRVDVLRQPRVDAPLERPRVNDERTTRPSTSVLQPFAHRAVELGCAGQRFARLRRVQRAIASRRFDDVGLFHERDDLLDLGPFELAPEQARATRRSTSQRVDHRQRVHALVDVVARRLAELGLARGDVEHVVDHSGSTRRGGGRTA